MRKMMFCLRLFLLVFLISLPFLSCGNPNQVTYTSVPSNTAGIDSTKMDRTKSTLLPVPKTYIVDFNVPGEDSCRVIITVHNSGTKVVRHLIDSTYTPGKYSYEWDRRGDDKEILKTGLYYYQFDICGKVSTLRLRHMPRFE
jgi:flagellar hook assembly protein FlgD